MPATDAAQSPAPGARHLAFALESAGRVALALEDAQADSELMHVVDGLLEVLAAYQDGRPAKVDLRCGAVDADTGHACDLPAWHEERVVCHAALSPEGVLLATWTQLQQPGAAPSVFTAMRALRCADAGEGPDAAGLAAALEAVLEYCVQLLEGAGAEDAHPSLECAEQLLRSHWAQAPDAGDVSCRAPSPYGPHTCVLPHGHRGDVHVALGAHGRVDAVWQPPEALGGPA